MGRAAAATRVVAADHRLLAYQLFQDEQSATFDGWLRAASPELNWEWPHIVAIREALDGVTSGEIRRLVITVPPQHGKSTLVTIHYPVWRILRDPSMPWLIGSYNEEKAAEFATKARKLAAPWVSFAPDVNRADEWQTTAGGGIVSIGTTSGTGRAARGVILDDPFKDPQDAESLARREIVWRWYTQVILTRRPQAIIVVATRWHEDDLTGRLLDDTAADPPWVHVHLRALSNGPATDPLGRLAGEPLCPELQTRKELEEWRRISPYGFATMGQGDATTREGSLVHLEELLPVDKVPDDLPGCRGWDVASSLNRKADETAGGLIRGPDSGGIYYIEDVEHGRWEYVERDEKIRAVAERDGVNVIIVGPEDPGHEKKRWADAWVKLLDGFQAFTSDVLARKGATPDSKAQRAEPFIKAINAGKIRMRRAEWNAVLKHQLEKFPNGLHDDLVDALALAYIHLSLADRSEPASRPVEQRQAPGRLQVGRWGKSILRGR